MMKATKVEHVAPMRPRMTPRSRTTAATSHVPARNDSVKPATYLRRSGGPVAASLSLAPASTPKFRSPMNMMKRALPSAL